MQFRIRGGRSCHRAVREGFSEAVTLSRDPTEGSNARAWEKSIPGRVN